MDMNAAKNQHESFKSAMTPDDSFSIASQGLIVTEEMHNVEDYPLLECTTRQFVDSMVGRIGVSVLHRSTPRRVTGAPQLQALLKDLTDPSATVYEGDGSSRKETTVANVQRT